MPCSHRTFPNISPSYHMKHFLLAALIVCVSSLVGRGQELAELAQPPNSNNEKAEVSQWIGPVKITIDYHSPHVHLNGAERTGRIWGELIPFGFFDDGYGPSKAQPWRAGANETTTITVSHDVKIEGKELKAGTYGLFLALNKSGPWTWIFSSHSIGWGAYQYDPKNDVLRVNTNPEDAPFTEFLTYGFDDRLPSSAVAYLQWENKRIPFKIEVPNVNEIYVAQLRDQLRSVARISIIEIGKRRLSFVRTTTWIWTKDWFGPTKRSVNPFVEIH